MCWTGNTVHPLTVISVWRLGTTSARNPMSYDDRSLTHNAFDIMHIFSDIQQNGLDRSKNIAVCAGGVEISGTARLSKKHWAVVACNYNQPGEFWSFEAVCAHRCQSQSDWCSEWDVADQQTRVRSLWKRSCQWSCLLWLMLQRQSRGTVASSVDCSAQCCVLPFTMRAASTVCWLDRHPNTFLFSPITETPNTLRSRSDGAAENGSH